MYLHAVLRDLRGRTGHRVTRYEAMAIRMVMTILEPSFMRSPPMELALSAAGRVDMFTTIRLAPEPVAVGHNSDESST